MIGEKIVFKIVPGETLSQGWNEKIRWLNFSSIKKAKLVRLEKEDETIELPVRICGNKVGKRGFLCITDEEENTLKSISSNDKTGYSEYTENDVGFLYQGDILLRVSMSSDWKDKLFNYFFSYTQPSVSKYQYVTQEELNDTYKYYFSDEKGKMIQTNDNRSLQYIGLNISEGKIKDALSKIPENIILSKAFAKVFVEKLTEGQLNTLANNLNNEKLQILVKNLTDKQLQVLAEHLTDGQFQALVDHLTSHQLQTLAKELNPEKLQIIVSLLDQDQFKALIKTLNDEQVKEILPHL
ncbi:hypothetical protein IYZ83_000365 [Wolbachia pipientis]|uniref:hypothetical protein n=1 Tax=Wolbachia pipientis TaxID=955 RepID=UPI001F209AA0|nr:hypothetical protein [Wolbachia pipientis]UIP91730.1 hypothetical protein IYZ83_000365 [Wolbachia pipientis]